MFILRNVIEIWLVCLFDLIFYLVNQDELLWSLFLLLKVFSNKFVYEFLTRLQEFAFALYLDIV